MAAIHAIFSLSMTQRHFTRNDVLMFVTTNTFKRMKVFSNPSRAREAVDCLYRVQQLQPFFLYAFVIMSDHVHFLLSVPAPGDISKIMNSYKSAVVQSIGMQKIWQSRYYLKIPSDANETLHYIHHNPVKARYVERPQDYPWSSASGKWDVSELEINLLTAPSERRFVRWAY